MNEYEAKEKLEKMKKNLDEMKKLSSKIEQHLKNGLSINENSFCVNDLEDLRERVNDKKEHELVDVIDEVDCAIYSMPN